MLSSQEQEVMRLHKALLPPLQQLPSGVVRFIAEFAATRMLTALIQRLPDVSALIQRLPDDGIAFDSGASLLFTTTSGSSYWDPKARNHGVSVWSPHDFRLLRRF